MGAVCSKEANHQEDSRPVVPVAAGSVAAASTSHKPLTARLPKSRKVKGPGNVIGGDGPVEGSAAANAALAAERRANAQRPKGALGQKLDEQRKLSNNQVLKQMADEERRKREIHHQQGPH